MVLNTDEVKRIALLAAIEVAPEERATTSRELARIVTLMAEIREVELQQNPISAPTAQAREAVDTPGPCLQQEIAADNAPDFVDGYVVVPEVGAGGRR